MLIRTVFAKLKKRLFALCLLGIVGCLFYVMPDIEYDVNHVPFFRENGKAKSIAELTAGTKVRQTFVCPGDNFFAFGIEFTNDEGKRNGLLKVNLRDGKTDELIHSAPLSAASLKNRAINEIVMPVLRHTRNRKFTIEIQGIDGLPGNSVTVLADPAAGDTGLTVNGVNQSGALIGITGCKIAIPVFERRNGMSMLVLALLVIGFFCLFFCPDDEVVQFFNQEPGRWTGPGLLLLLFALGFGAGLLFWNRISLPFSNPLEVVGPLTLIQFSPVTNYARFIVLVSLPVVLLLSLLLVTKSKSLLSLKTHYEEPVGMGMERPWLKKFLVWAGILSIPLFIVTPFLTLLTAPYPVTKLDALHEGERLTPGLTYKMTGGLWTGSWFCHGALSDPLTSFYGWKLFGCESIGAQRLMVSLQDAVTESLFGFLIIVTALAFCPKKDWGGRLILSQFLIASYLLTLFDFQFLNRRDAFVCLGLICLLRAFVHGNPLLFFLAGLGSALNYFYSIDRGAYFTAILLFSAVAWLLWPTDKLSNRLRSSSALLCGIVFGWMIFWTTFGPVEFHAFIENTLLFYQTKDLYDSYVFTFENNTGMVSMAAIAIQLLVLIWCLASIIFRGDFAARTPWMIQAVFAILALFYFRSGLGRSDQGHVAYCSSFAIIGLAFPLLWLARELRFPKFNLLLLSLFLIFNFFLQVAKLPSNWSNLWTTRERWHAFASVPDSAFIDPEVIPDIAHLQDLFQNEEGLFSLDFNPALPYLLKKPSLDKNYFIWFCGSRPKRAELVTTLQTKRPRYLIFDNNDASAVCDGISNEQRIPQVRAYILKHYHQFEQVGPWQVMEANELPAAPH